MRYDKKSRKQMVERASKQGKPTPCFNKEGFHYADLHPSGAMSISQSHMLRQILKHKQKKKP